MNFLTFHVNVVTSVTSKIEMKKNSTLIHFSDVISITSVTSKKIQEKGDSLELNVLVIKSANFDFTSFSFVYFQIFHVTDVTSVASKMDMKKNYALIYFLMSLVSPGKKIQKKEENLELNCLVIKSANFNFT